MASKNLNDVAYTVPGYTYKVNVYAGKNDETKNTTPYNVVMDLLSGLLNKGHTLYSDNWYTVSN